jgi:hypothetical protein
MNQVVNYRIHKNPTLDPIPESYILLTFSRPISLKTIFFKSLQSLNSETSFNIRAGIAQSV